MSFRKEDEAWRCSTHQASPLVLGATAEPALNARLPTSTADLMDRLKLKGVQLESAVLSGDKALLTIRCFNSNRLYKKLVRVRYTLNNWASAQEVSGEQTTGGDSLAVRFVAAIPLGAKVVASDGRLQFAIRFKVGGNTYWDTNSDTNYIMDLRTGRERMASVAGISTDDTAPLQRAPSKSILHNDAPIEWSCAV